MKTVYANRFLVRPPATNSPPNLFRAIQADVVAWASGRVLEREGVEISVPELGQQATEKGTTIKTEGSGLPEKVAIWKLTYDHADDNDSTRRWRTTLSLAVLGDIVEVTAVIAAGKPGRRIDPDLPAFIGRPNIVRDIFAKYPCGIEGHALSSRAITLGANDVETFVTEQLVDSKRILPVVVVSPDQYGATTVDAHKLASALAGLAITRIVADPNVTFELSDILGNKLSVFDGGVRIYWPEFGTNDNPYRHELFLRRDLERYMPAERVQLISRPIMMFAAATAIEDGPLYQRARQGLLQLHHKKFEADGKLAREAIAASKLLKSGENAALSKAIESLLEEVAAKTNLIEIHEATIESMTEEMENLRQTLYLIDKERSRTPETQDAVIAPKSVLEAVGAAATQFPTLRIWGSAHDAATRSLSNRAARVWETLEILADVASKYFAAKRQGKGLGAPLEDVFRKRGTPKYAPQDSETTTTMFKAEHTFSDGGRSVHFSKHFTIKGKPQDCVQIYFEFDEHNERIDVGYVGEHLPFASDDS